MEPSKFRLRSSTALIVFVCSLSYAVAFFGLGWFRGAVLTGYLAPFLCSISGLFYLRRTRHQRRNAFKPLVTLGVAISTALLLMGISLLISLVFGTK